MATSSLADFSFNFIGKEPDLLKRLSAPNPSQYPDSQEWEHSISPPILSTSQDSGRLSESQHQGRHFSVGFGRPTLLQALSGGDLDHDNDMNTARTEELSNHGTNGRVVHPRNSSGSTALHQLSPSLPMAEVNDAPQPSHSQPDLSSASSSEDSVVGHSVSRVGPALSLSSEAPPTSTDPIVSPSSAGPEGCDTFLTLQYPPSYCTGSCSDSAVELVEVKLEQVDSSDISPPVRHLSPSGTASSSTVLRPQLSSSDSPKYPHSDAIARLKSLHDTLLSSIDSPASIVELNGSGSSEDSLAGSTSLSTTLSKVLDYSTRAKTFAEMSIKSAEVSLKAAHASHHSAKASFKAASDVKTLVGEVVEAVKRRDDDLKTTLERLGVWIGQYKQDIQGARNVSAGEDVEMEEAAQEDSNGSRSDEEDEAQICVREERHLEQLREQEALAKQKLSEAEKNIAAERSLRERMQYEKEEAERKRQETEAEERERQLRLAEEREMKRKIAEEEQAARQRRIAELQQKLAEERTKQAEEAERKRLEEEKMRKEEEEEAERCRQRDQEIERQRLEQERQAAEEQARKDAEQRHIAEERNAAEAERQRLVGEKRKRVEEANRQRKIEQDRLKPPQEADREETKEKEIYEERKLREELKLRESKSQEPSQQLARQEKQVGVRPAVELKAERGESAQLYSASPPAERSQSNHPPLTVGGFKTSLSMSPSVPFAPSSSAAFPRSYLSPSLPKKPLSFNPVSSQTLVPTKIDTKPTKAEKKGLKRERQTASSGGDFPGDSSKTPTQEEVHAIALGLREPGTIPNPAAASVLKRQAASAQAHKSRPKQPLHVHTHTNVNSSRMDGSNLIQQPISSNSTDSEAPCIHSYDITNTEKIVIKSEYSPVIPDVRSLNIRHVFGTRTTQEISSSGTINQPVEVPMAKSPRTPPSRTASRVQYHNSALDNVPWSSQKEVRASLINTRPVGNVTISPDMGDAGWRNVMIHSAPDDHARQDDTSHNSRYAYSPSPKDQARTPPLPPPTHTSYSSTSSSYHPDNSYRPPSPREPIEIPSQMYQTMSRKRPRERERDDLNDRRRGGWAPGEHGDRVDRHPPRPHDVDVYMPGSDSSIPKRPRINRRRFQASPPTPSPPPSSTSPVPSSLAARFSHSQPQMPDQYPYHNEDHNRGRTSSGGTVSLLSRLADEATSSGQWSARQDSNGNGNSGKRGGGGGGNRGNAAAALNKNLSRRLASDNVQPLWDRLS